MLVWWNLCTVKVVSTRGAVVPGPPFHVLAHRLLHAFNTVYSKCAPFWFMAPPSGFWPPLLLNTGDWPVYCTCCSRQNPQSVVHILLKFAKRQSNEIYHSLWTSHFSAGMLVRWNIHTVATAVQPTLVEMTNHWCNLLENSAKLKNAEKPQIPNFAFHCRNAVLVKHVNVL